MLYHLEDIEKIREIQLKTEEISNQTVIDISNWNSGKKYQSYIHQYLHFPMAELPYNYVYTYEIDDKIHGKVLKKLNINYEDCTAIFLPSSTLAIVNIANFLQKKGCKKVCILQPSYFSVEPCLNSFGIEAVNISLLYKDDRFSIPMKDILESAPDAVWITSPIFCTNLYLDNFEVQKLNTFLEQKKYVIFDESLTSIYNIPCSNIVTNNYAISIHSPHKVLGTNATKFACIVSHKCYADFFNNWTDLYSGGLTLSSTIAIRHFLSDNYNFVLKKSYEYIHNTYIEVTNLLEKHRQYFSYTHAAGIYITVFFKYVPYEISTRISFIKKLIENTKVSLLPGYLEGFFENTGFCFRVNLTLDQNILLISVNKVLLYLENEYL